MRPRLLIEEFFSKKEAVALILLTLEIWNKIKQIRMHRRGGQGAVLPLVGLSLTTATILSGCPKSPGERWVFDKNIR